MDIDMVRNGVRVAYGYGDTRGYNMGTQVAIVMLEKGDMVWVRHAPSSTEVLRGKNVIPLLGLCCLQCNKETFVVLCHFVKYYIRIVQDALSV